MKQNWKINVTDRQLRDFQMLSVDIFTKEKIEGGIGTLGEKKLHAILKHYLCPDESRHEIRLSDALPSLTAAEKTTAKKYVADILTESGEIYEIQTGSFAPLRAKIGWILENTPYSVTVVHPISVKKYINRIDAVTGELLSRRLSPKSGSLNDLAQNLYYVTNFLGSPRFGIRVLAIETEEYQIVGTGKKTRRGREKKIKDRLPTKLYDEIDFFLPEDFEVFLPDALPQRFTAAQFSQATRLHGPAVYGTLGALVAVGLLKEGEPAGRAKTWEKIL